MSTELTVLGLETSCDDTAAGVIKRSPTGQITVLSSEVVSQDDLHALYGGVVPEIAARAHAERCDLVVKKAMTQAGLTWADLDGVAATAGPGLVGGVMAGLMTAKAIAWAHHLPLLAVNHLAGHALSPRLAEPVALPYVLLLISGGHCQILLVEDIDRFTRLGTTLDDAAGECFDKCAKVLGLGFPGGPALQAAAEGGTPGRFALPTPLKGKPGCDFSFSGLKTAVAQWVEQITPDGIPDLAADIQIAIADHLLSRLGRGLQQAAPLLGPEKRLVVAGGVAANLHIRARLEDLCQTHGFSFYAPPLKYCTDNGAMIALAGAERLARGLTDPLDAPARPRWPLDELRAETDPSHTPGRKGAKA